jgi:hypothetical protein
MHDNLRLIGAMMRLGQLLSDVGGGAVISDAGISTICKGCGTEQRLDTARIRQKGTRATEYYCKTDCGQLLAAVRKEGGTTYAFESVNGLSVAVGPNPAAST